MTAIYTLPVIDIIPETADTQTFRLGGYLPFKAGQSIRLTLPGDPKKRYYSLSSSPTEKDFMAITIKATDKDKALYDSLFHLKKGSTVEVTGPYGSLTLPEPLEGPLYFLAAGSGVAPFRSMVKFIADTQPATETWLLHSVRSPEDLLFKEEFLEWAQKPVFHYIPTFTRWNTPEFLGETGRIGETLLRKHISFTRGTFYVCGSKEFAKDMESVLQQLQVLPQSIRREQW